MSNYEDILNRPWGDLPEPQTLPEGSWLLRGVFLKFNGGDEENNKPPFVNLGFRAEEAMDDVSADDLAALGENYDVGAGLIFKRLNLDGQDGWEQLRTIQKKMGAYDPSKSPVDGAKDFNGKAVVGYLKVRKYTDKNTGEEKTVNDIVSFMPAE